MKHFERGQLLATVEAIGRNDLPPILTDGTLRYRHQPEAYGQPPTPPSDIMREMEARLLYQVSRRETWASVLRWASIDDGEYFESGMYRGLLRADNAWQIDGFQTGRAYLNEPRVTYQQLTIYWGDGKERAARAQQWVEGGFDPQLLARARTEVAAAQEIVDLEATAAVIPFDLATRSRR